MTTGRLDDLPPSSSNSSSEEPTFLIEDAADDESPGEEADVVAEEADELARCEDVTACHDAARATTAEIARLPASADDGD